MSTDTLLVFTSNYNKECSYYYDLTSMKELRDKTKSTLSQFLKSEKNIDSLERVIYDYTFTKKEYTDTLKHVIGLLDEKKLRDIIMDIKKGKINFECDIYGDADDTIKKEVMKIQTPVEVVEGMFTCKKCGSKKTHHIAIQTRRSDEPPTIDIRCLNKECLYKWRVG